jgi:autotransporter-associated beta strand protein
LQFAADGYLLTASGGGALTTDTSSFISVDGGNTATISAPINGAGEIVKQGAGLLRLGGENGYQGGTQLTAGRIEVLSHKALGTGTLSMAGDTTLAAGISGLMLANAITTAGNASVDTAANIFTLDGQISGAGSLTKLGTGTLSLTGANTFTGGMTISAGTVTGAASNYGSGGIVNNAALIFNEAGDGSFGQVISGTGTVSKIGAGTLTIAAINTLTGPTTVTAGRLNVTGSLGSSAVTVQTGASLSGSGTVGPLIAQSGSVITPGSTAGAIATLAVNGAFTLAAGATLAVDVSPTLGGDRVAATGAASLAGNLVVTPATGPYTTFFQSYTLVSGSALTGTFATSALGSFGAPFVPVLVYNATSVTLRLTPNSLVTLGGVGLGGNGLVVAGAFDYNPQPFFNLYTQGTNLPTALSQLSGELHSAERRVALDDTRVVREAAFDRLNAGLSAIAGSQSVTTENAGKATTFWLRGAGSWGTAKADGIGSRFTTEQRGFLTGIDFASNGYTLGGLFHFTSTDVDLASLGKSKVESVGGAIYAGYRQENSGLAIGAGGSLASTKFDGARAITAPGLAQSLTSRADATTYQVFGEVAYDLASAENIRAEPYFRVAYARVDSNSMNEAGGSAAVFAGKQNNSLTLTTVGLRGAYNIGKATLSGSAGWQRTSGDRAFSTVLAITGVNRPHTVRSVAVDRDAVALEAQASFNLSSKVRLGAGYSGVIGSKNTDHGARATLTVGF